MTALNDRQRLRFRPVVRLVPLDDQRWSVWLGAQSSQLAGGAAIAPLVSDLIELLDGEREVGEVARAISERRGVSPAVVRELLARFYDWMIVDDGAGYAPEGGDHDRLAAQLRFLALSSSLPVAAQRRIADARVAVLGMNGVGEHVALALAGAGVGRLVISAGAPVTAADRGAFPYLREDEARPAGDALAAVLGRLRPGVAVTIVAEGEVPDTDLVVVATRDLHAAEVAAINERCVAAGRPLLLVGVDMVQGFVGPLVIARETPCLECVATRLDQTASELMVRMRPRPSHVEPAPLAAVIANLAAIEALKFLAQVGAPTIVATQLQLDARWLAFSTTEFFRHPRCRVCGPLVDRAAAVVFDVASLLGDAGAA